MEMSKQVSFRPLHGQPELSIETVMRMKDYILSVRYFMEGLVPSYEERLLTEGDFELLDPSFINEVSRLKNGGFLDLQVNLFLRREDEVPFCVVPQSPGFLATVNYESLKRSSAT